MLTLTQSNRYYRVAPLARRRFWLSLFPWTGRPRETPVVLIDEDHTQLNARLAHFVGELPTQLQSASDTRLGDRWL